MTATSSPPLGTTRGHDGRSLHDSRALPRAGALGRAPRAGARRAGWRRAGSRARASRAAAGQPAPPAPRLVVHGTVVPTSQARVGTLSGGVLLEIGAPIGTQVEAQRELARVRGPSGVEVLTAPFAGTVTGLLANTGDTLCPAPAWRWWPI